MKVVLFAAGLGDFIRSCYTTNSYSLLSEVRETIAVVLALHNPFGGECFVHHPNRPFLNIIDLPGQYDHLRSIGLKGGDLRHALLQAAGVPHNEVISRRVDSKPVFYAADDVKARDYIVIQPFASVAVRNIPIKVLRQVVTLCAGAKREIHIITRSYPRSLGAATPHDGEYLPRDIVRHPLVVWHRNLSAPASLNLVKNCRFFVGSHSALLQAAWFEHKPVHVLYPKGHHEWSSKNIGSGYTFGAKFDGTVAQPFHEFQSALLADQLRRVFDNQSTTETNSAQFGNV